MTKTESDTRGNKESDFVTNTVYYSNTSSRCQVVGTSCRCRALDDLCQEMQCNYIITNG